MNSLKIGDRVKIISSEKASTVFEFIRLMKIYCEKEAIIKRKIEIEGKIYYKIDLDEQFFYWVEDSLKKKKRITEK